MIDQEHYGVMHRRRVDDVIVVKNQYHVEAFGPGELVDQRGHQPIEGRRRRWPE
jgi:hypothetical protein